MKEKIFEREMKRTVEKYIDRNEIIAIRGPRQAGKTTLMKSIADDISGTKRFVNMDIPEDRNAFAGNPLAFVRRFKEKGKLHLFLDEIQRVNNAGEGLKMIYDEMPDVKIFVSGSSSLEMKSEVLPPLVGRLFLFDLRTFSFGEFLMAKDRGLHKAFLDMNESLKSWIPEGGKIEPPAFSEELLSYWKEYAVFGGYPEAIKAENDETKRTILENIKTLYLEKDIVSFFGINDTLKFESFLKALAFGISGPLSASSMSSELGLSSYRLDEYVNILCHTYVLSILRPYRKNLITELKKTPKSYFLDLGLRNSVIGDFRPFDSRPDGGALLENFIFRELKTSFSDFGLNYWRTAGGAEIDFILNREDSIIPVECKSGGGSLGKGFYSFIDAYKPKRAVVATLSEFGVRENKGTEILSVPAFYF